MRIALFGNNIDYLMRYKLKLEHDFAETMNTVQIECFSDRKRVREQLFDYDIAILSVDILKEVTFCDKRQRRKEITVTSQKQIETFNVDEVLYIEAESKNIHIWTERREIIIKFKISEIEKLLNETGFLKTHRSYLVNMKHIRSIIGNEVVLKNGKRVPVSKYRIQDVTKDYLNWTNSG